MTVRVIVVTRREGEIDREEGEGGLEEEGRKQEMGCGGGDEVGWRRAVTGDRDAEMEMEMEMR